MPETAVLELTEAGLSTTVQDFGRVGYFEMGIPTGGAMDLISMATANVLVGNAPGTAALEAVYTLPRFALTAPTTMAVTGGAVTVKVDGEERPSWTTLELEPGQEVSFSVAKAGPRVYLAFSGGIDVPVVYGSRSTYLAGGLGGFQGRALASGDRVPVGSSVAGLPRVRTVPEEYRLAARARTDVRVVPGLHVRRLTTASYEAFFGEQWTLTPLGDRSGLRYSGPATQWTVPPGGNVFGAGSDPSNSTDAPYPLGSIQIPGGNEPILLHRDAPTMGGYAMVGVTARADLDVVAQHMPGQRVRFVPTSRTEALAAWDAQRRWFAGLQAALGV